MIDKKHIEKEKNRSIDNLNRVFLYKDENSGWYRAHEWSACLVEFYNRNIDKKDRLKPIHKMFTENESVISVGLQIKSFDKFLPDLDIEFKENCAEFLGAFILPYRTYISNESLRRIYYRLLTLKIKGCEFINSINSYFGVFSHYNSHNILKKIFQFI